jgi:AbrB family looped-hinge helix DNA binding protein
LLEIVGLSGRRKHRLSELSGGEQQRVAIAVALANNPKLLLADEPTGEVDTKTAELIYQIFHSLQEEFGLTTLIVSHDTQLAKHVDRVIAIRDGKISAEMVRQQNILYNSNQPDLSATLLAGESDNQHVELTVVDSSGRLQIPKNLRDQFNIRDRVLLEGVTDGVLIRPVETTKKESAEDLLDQLEQTRKGHRLQRLLQRFGGKGHGD